MPFLHSIFAMELCFPYNPGDGLHSALRQAVLSQPGTLTAGQKWEFYRHVSALLSSELGRAITGCWDFFDDDARAQRDFQMWFDGMATREGSRKEPSGQGDPYRGDERYLTFTIALLLQQGSYSERTLNRVCTVGESQLWLRSTFARLLAALPGVSFSAVKGDVVYLLPRDHDWGLTAGDLRAAKFEYLRRLG